MDTKRFNQALRYKKYIENLEKEKKQEKKISGKIKRNKKGAKWASMKQKKLNSKYENIIKELLDSISVKYVWQKPFFDENRFIAVDFFIPSKNIVLEIDGQQHYKGNSVEYDIKRTAYLKKRHGIKRVVRVANTDVINNYAKVYSRLKRLLK
jgi:very-short-patch-repair endonuclease